MFEASYETQASAIRSHPKLEKFDSSVKLLPIGDPIVLQELPRLVYDFPAFGISQFCQFTTWSFRIRGSALIFEVSREDRFDVSNPSEVHGPREHLHSHWCGRVYHEDWTTFGTDEPEHEDIKISAELGPGTLTSGGVSLGHDTDATSLFNRMAELVGALSSAVH